MSRIPDALKEKQDKTNSDPMIHWSRLWRTGVLHSCTQAFHENYGGEIREFWCEQFERLRDRAKLVDIGTGNGSLALLARQSAIAKGIELEIHGVDLAEISPSAVLNETSQSHPSIIFHSCVSATNLPFESHTVEFVCAQYAFEYMPPHDTLREIMRVLTPSGRAAFIMHSEDSIIHSVSQRQIEDFTYLTQENEIVRHARDLIPFMASNGLHFTSRTSGESVRARFNHAAEGVMSRVLEHEASYLLKRTASRLHGIMHMANLDSVEAQRLLTQLEVDLADENARLEDMASASTSDIGRKALIESISRTYGRSASLAPITVNGACMGWAIAIDERRS